MFINKKIYFGIFIAFVNITLGCGYANAIAVNKTFEVADENGKGELKIANNDNKDMFIRFELSKVTYDDGKKILTPLNKDNMKDWNLYISPGQLIIKDKERRTVRINYVCDEESSIDQCNRFEDQIYAIDVLPVPYSESMKSSVAISFGYKLYFMVPAKMVDFRYAIKRISKSEFLFENKSNTLLNAVINTCKKEFKNNCIYENRLLPGQSRKFSIPERLHEEKKINVTIINPNQEIKDYVSI
ncbi:hypothetical protein EDB65_102273 [Vibrio crassostreae]|uniref:pilus assembly protein n=1 Tax=Vibrio crassostreae TaxID=246167 RepID=UPI00104A51BB|nr:pilus assembly protein [Vibrio crassostreae]TCN88486.1 hypothetical protein EDB65_102273 [Vibrio crassostreae]